MRIGLLTQRPNQAIILMYLIGYYGYKFDVLLGGTIPTMLQYTLPDTIKEDGYKLKIQKQSGIGNIPLKVTVITSDGKVHVKEVDFKHDIVFELIDDVEGKKLVVVEK